MGFFSKLFEKKECAICGGEIGMLGNRKLEDGNMCKKCAAKLSPWFSERRHSTVAQIEQQLAYREQNQQELQNFQPAHRIGDHYKLIAEERNGVPYRFVVTDGNDYVKENADLILFKDVSSCVIDVDENRTEQMQQNDKGERVSYNPPRYEYSYYFQVKMTIENNPYFDEINFRLNSFSVDIRPDLLGRLPVQRLGRLMLGEISFDPNEHPEYRKYMKMCDEIEALVDAGRHGTAVGGEAVEEVVVQESSSAKFCSQCGAPVSGGSFCTQCGSRL